MALLIGILLDSYFYWLTILDNSFNITGKNNKKNLLAESFSRVTAITTDSEFFAISSRAYNVAETIIG